MITDAVQCFDAQVEWNQGDVGAPKRMIEAMRDKWRECVFAGMPARAMATVVADRNRLGEGDVESDCLGDRASDLSHLECVGESGALMIVWEHEHLGLSCETTKG